MPYKEILSAVAIVVTFFAFVPYIRSIMDGTTKPHVFSWVIWSSTTFIVFLAQLSDDGGVGAWPIGVSSFITLYVAILAYRKKSDIHITASDWLFLTMAFGTLPLWYFTSDPLLVVIILTTVDIFGFAPTFRKAYHNPYGEQLKFYAMMAMRDLIAISALENYSLTTTLFPIVMSTSCWIFIAMVFYKRQAEPAP